MYFYIINNIADDNLKNRLAPYFLFRIDNWNDFSYRTQFYAAYIDNNYEKHDLGHIRIAFNEDWKKKLNANEYYNYVDFIPKQFTNLERGFYSLGNLTFYRGLQTLFSVEEMVEILKKLQDISVDLAILDDALSKNLGVIRTSLMRDNQEDEIRNKIHRIANGGVELTPYRFNFDYYLNDNNKKTLNFEVMPNSLPPTNVHVVIGGNGVGKTTFLNTILKEYFDESILYNISHIPSLSILLNLVVVSYSPFDRLFKDIELDKLKGKKYSYIGLREDPTIYRTENYKNITSTNKDFIVSLFKCGFSEILKNKWLKLVAILEIDGYFKNRNLKKIIEDVDISIVKNDTNFNINNLSESDIIAIVEKNKKLIAKFNDFSSGHKIILLSLTKLVVDVIEKSLVIYDEPETYLHPPLISAYIRALSWLMIDRNAVAVIATHSPVILQEVPRRSVWIISREGEEFGADRPPIETFGESVSTLTKEVFNLRTKKSGFYTLIEKLVNSVFEDHPQLSLAELFDLVLDKFGGEVGDEAQSIIISLINKLKRESQ